jgi:hypothetical protein
MTTTTATHPDVPISAGATDVYAWHDGKRRFYGTLRDSACDQYGSVEVLIGRDQHLDGTIERRILIREGCAFEGLPDTAASRALAADLIPAADEWDELEAKQ